MAINITEREHRCTKDIPKGGKARPDAYGVMERPKYGPSSDKAWSTYYEGWVQTSGINFCPWCGDQLVSN